jgi:carboxypeptidase family protein
VGLARAKWTLFPTQEARVRGPFKPKARVLALFLVMCIGAGNFSWPQENQNPPPAPPGEVTPPPQQPPPSTPPSQTPPTQTPPAQPAPQTTPQEPAAAQNAPESQEAHAVKGASLKGRIFGIDRKTPLAGAVVHAIPTQGEVKSSQPSDAKGHYLLGGIEPGTYTLAVSSEGGVYTLESPLGVASAKAFTVDLATVPAASSTAGIPGVEGTPRGFCYMVQGKKPAGMAFWKSPKGIILLAATAAAIGLILAQSGGGNHEENSVSPSAP